MTTMYERITDKKIEEIVADIQYYVVIDDKEKAEMLLRTLALLRTPPHTDTDETIPLKQHLEALELTAEATKLSIVNECIEIVKKHRDSPDLKGYSTLITALEALKK